MSACENLEQCMVKDCQEGLRLHKAENYYAFL